MLKQDSCCCGNGNNDRHENCVVCGKPLIYFTEEKLLPCHICGKVKQANAACEGGHFICDECHRAGGGAALNFLMKSKEQDPIALFLQVCQLDGVHLHGPEHHSLIPCVLLTAYHNCGGKINLQTALAEGWKRGQKLAGGSCGFLGVCGAAGGAGIFASIVSGATPLTPRQWAIPQKLTAACLEAIADTGGPRCCKRTGRIAIECAAEFSAKEFSVPLPCSRPRCGYSARNRECIRNRCPFFAAPGP